MPQKLSAMRYIKNNKRRTAVLIVSLCLCFVLTYLTQFLLSCTEESFRSVAIENAQKMQIVKLGASSYGIDTENTEQEERVKQYKQKEAELVEKLKGLEGVKHVYNVQYAYACINPLIGQWYHELPLVEKDAIPVYLKHFGAELSEGRMPESKNEVVLDSATMANNGYEIGSYLLENDYGQVYKIVGVLDCDYYFGCGLQDDEIDDTNTLITILSEGIEDIESFLVSEGYTIRENKDTIVDYEHGKKIFKEEVTDAIETSTRLIFIGIIVLLSIALFIVYTTYLRDRHNEWCLYSSIGYSHKTIYASILRELLFTFGSALLIGGVLIVISEAVLYNVFILPQGLRCRFFNPKTLSEILCSYVLLLGILQIPVRYALFRIRTIDAMDDDLY